MRWITPFLPRETLQASERRVWIALLLLCPVAYVFGVLLEQHNVEHHKLPVGVSRSKAISLARQFVFTHGVDAHAWNGYCAAIPDEDLFLYGEKFHSASAKALEQVSPALPLRIALLSPDARQWALVRMDLQGRVSSYDLQNAHHILPAGSLDDGGLQRLAESALARQQTLLPLLSASRPEIVNKTSVTLGPARSFTWHSAFTGQPELRLNATITVQGATVLAENYSGSVDPQFVEANLKTHSSLFTVIALSYGLLVFLLVIYSFWRFVRRTMAKEISYRRLFLVAGITAAFILVNIGAASDSRVDMQFENGNNQAPIFFLWTIFTSIAIGGGLLFGVAYASAEGDLREAYPGKMTSLDTLILGRLFSANVARSMVVGVAFSAWMVLLQSGMLALLHERSGWHAMSPLQLSFMRFPFVTLVLSQPMSVLVGAVIALMLPLTFVYRNFSRRSVRACTLAVASFLALVGPFLNSPSPAYFFISVLFCMGCLLLPFFRFDLLAAMFCYGAFVVVHSTTRMSALFPGSGGTVQVLALLGLLAMAVQIWRSYTGRLCSDEAVRPVYASHLAERLSLRAEVAAAREAQLRLLPQAAPDAPGLSIAAFCLPASVVGGDFYDFFALSGGRIGIFVAEGGNQGLASALTIALAKGYLMHTVQSNHTPAEIVVRLEGALGSILVEGCARTSVAYAVVDSASGQLRYARTGTHPKLLLVDGPEPLHERIVTVVGRSIMREAIWEGSASIEAGTSLLFYTRGLESRLNEAWGSTHEKWRRRLAVREGELADTLSERLTSTAAPKRRGAAHAPEKDLTAVVVRVLQTGAKAMEGVA